MWNGTLRSRTHPVELPYPCTWKNTPVATRGLPEGQAIGISWGATRHSPVHQEHQHSHLSLDKGTLERRRRRYFQIIKSQVKVRPTGHVTWSIKLRRTGKRWSWQNGDGQNYKGDGRNYKGDGGNYKGSVHDNSRSNQCYILDFEALSRDNPSQLWILSRRDF